MSKFGQLYDPPQSLPAPGYPKHPISLGIRAESVRHPNTLENNPKINRLTITSNSFNSRNDSHQQLMSDASAAQFFEELDRQENKLDIQRAQLEKQRERQADLEMQCKLASRIDTIQREMELLDHHRQIDRNRQLAKLSRFGHIQQESSADHKLPPITSYLLQPRWLAAARKLSDRTPTLENRGGGLAGAYYSVMTQHLPRGLPFFADRDGFFASNLNSKGSKIRDPFTESIGFDYGYGRMKALGSYGLTPDRLSRTQTHLLDDLYLYELLLRLDCTLDEQERVRRWQERLRWEEIVDSRERVENWSRMAADARRRLGVDEGSFWAANLFGAPLSPRMGYTTRPLAGPAMNSSRHYNLTPGLASRYPMWEHGGFGLGRRISNWMDRPYKAINLKHQQRREEIRREYAERRGEILPRSQLLGPGLMGTGFSTHSGLGTMGRKSNICYIYSTIYIEHPPPMAFELRSRSVMMIFMH